MSTLKCQTCRTVSVFFIALSVVASVAFAQSSDGTRTNPTSKIYIVEVEGLASINSGEIITDLNKKSVHAAEGVIIDLKRNSSSAGVLSNGTGIAFSPDTSLEIKRFRQEPFSPNPADLDIEPSVSQTSAFLSRGSIGLATSKLVAGSSMIYSTRHINMAIRGRKLVIEANDNETVISLVDGDVTLQESMIAGGQTLKPGQQAIVTRPSHFAPPVVRIQPIPAADLKAIEVKIAIAQMARQTVYFDVAARQNEDGGEQIITPVEVLPGTLTPPNTISPYKIP